MDISSGPPPAPSIPEILPSKKLPTSTPSGVTLGSTNRVDYDPKNPKPQAEAYPMSWLRKCPISMHYMCSMLSHKPVSFPFLVSDYAPGWAVNVPFFFRKHWESFFKEYTKDTVPMQDYQIICIDLHDMRMDNLWGKLNDISLAPHVRTVTAKFEKMVSKASFPLFQNIWIKENQSEQTPFDTYLLKEQKIPISRNAMLNSYTSSSSATSSESTNSDSPQTLKLITEEPNSSDTSGVFDVGLLCNDMIGFLANYYPSYSKVIECLDGVNKVQKLGSLLLITQPNMLFPCDNEKYLAGAGFSTLLFVSVDIRQASLKVSSPVKDFTSHPKYGSHFKKCLEAFRKPTETDDDYLARTEKLSFSRDSSDFWSFSPEKHVTISPYTPKDLTSCPLGFFMWIVAVKMKH